MFNTILNAIGVSLFRRVCVIAVIVCIVVASLFHPQFSTISAHAASASNSIPPWLQVPAHEQLVLQATVKQGVQVYRCTAPGYWALQGPTALLVGTHNELIVHSFGPRWQERDGSVITAQSIASFPQLSSIPWQLYKVNSHSGHAGLFSHINYVQLLNTANGVSPIFCNPAVDTSLATASYSATYMFWRPQ